MVISSSLGIKTLINITCTLHFMLYTADPHRMPPHFSLHDFPCTMHPHFIPALTQTPTDASGTGGAVCGCVPFNFICVFY